MAHIEGITVYPVKALDGVRPEAARVLPGGTLAGDREFALFDEDGEPFNGKRTDRVHRLDASYDPESEVLTVGTPDGEARAFDLGSEDGRDRAAAWFGEYFDESLTLKRDRELGFVDRRDMGPSVISTATLREVASWFDGMTVDGARRRLRANVEVGGVPAFWEDRFVGADAPAFVAGGVRFEGVKPCGRCVVPSRDPDTGEPLSGFRERFLDRREATFPEWADRSAFDHLFALMIIARVPDADRGARLRVGDPVEVVEA
ncbi:MAG: MOSC domain-containing protein [Haloarculaceae archaeon]